MTKIQKKPINEYRALWCYKRGQLHVKEGGYNWDHTYTVSEQTFWSVGANEAREGMDNFYGFYNWVSKEWGWRG